MSSSGSKAWSGLTKEVKMAILVGAIQVQRTQNEIATQGLQLLKLQTTWSYTSKLQPTCFVSLLYVC
ncbi:unnamed protein product [Brassica oleracea var. botrytis]